MKGEEFCRAHAGLEFGRPVKITDDMLKRLDSALSTGATRRACAVYAGISESSFYAYMERAEADIENGVASPFVDFLETVTRAEARADVEAMATMRQAMPLDWRACAWYLERRHPDEWGKSERLAVEHGGAIRTEVPEVPDTPERMAEVTAILRDAGVLSE